MSDNGYYPGDLNCDTCKMGGCKDHGLYSQYPNECNHFSHKKGCASHSNIITVTLQQSVSSEQKGKAQIAAYSYLSSIAAAEGISFYELVDKLLDQIHNPPQKKLNELRDWCSMYDDYTCGESFKPSFVIKKINSMQKD